jgi:multiple sugar transport system ATP-binding protein
MDLANSDGAGIAGAVAFVEDLGATLLAHVDVEAADRLRTLASDPDEPAAFSHRLRVLLDSSLTIQPGARLSLVPDPARIHLFDATTERAIWS